MASTQRSDQEGSVYQQHVAECARPTNARGTSTCKCKWRGALVIGWHDKKPIRKRVTAATRQGVVVKLDRLKDEVKKGQLPHGRIPTTGEWLSYWLENIVIRRNRPNTVRTYRTHVEGYLIPLLGRHRLDKLSPEHITAAWEALGTTGRPGSDGKPLSQNTVHHAHTILARALKVAEQRGKVVGNAALLLDAPSKGDEKKPTILDKRQVRAVIDASHASRNAARWTVAFSLGLRQGEALGLCWDDVDLDAGTVLVHRSQVRLRGQGITLGPTKSGKERTIVLPAPLLAELKAHRKAQNAERLVAGSKWVDKGRVFALSDGRPIDAKEDWKAWKRLLDAAGVPDVKGHTTRHTAATMLLAMGVPTEVAKEILGHSSIIVTQGYQHRVDDLHLDAAARMASAFWD